MTGTPPKLVTAQDIARARIAAMRVHEEGDVAHPMLRWFTELYRAMDEKRRGEWKLS